MGASRSAAPVQHHCASAATTAAAAAESRRCQVTLGAETLGQPFPGRFGHLRRESGPWPSSSALESITATPSATARVGGVALSRLLRNQIRKTRPARINSRRRTGHGPAATERQADSTWNRCRHDLEIQMEIDVTAAGARRRLAAD